LSSAPPPPPANSVEAAFEEDVRRYLMRKPMTTTELVLISAETFKDTFLSYIVLGTIHISS
jgi:hypothetical protein